MGNATSKAFTDAITATNCYLFNYNSALTKATLDGDLDKVQWLVEKKGTNIAATEDATGDTVLMNAVWRGHDEIVRYLIDFAEKNDRCLAVEKANIFGNTAMKKMVSNISALPLSTCWPIMGLTPARR